MARAQRPPNRGGLIARGLRTVNLTRDQRRAIRDIRDRNDPRMREFGRRMLDGRRQVDELLFAERSDLDRARGHAREMSRLAGERIKVRTLIELDVFVVLTPEQRASLRRMRDGNREQMRGALRERDAEAPGPAAAPPPDVPEDEDPPPLDDGPEAVEDRPEAAPDRRGQRAGGGPGGVLARMSLSPEQQQRFRRLRRQHAPRMRELSARFRQTQRAIDDALMADTIDAGLVRRLADEIGRLESERELARFETEAAIREILTPEQAALMRESRGRD